MQLYGIDFTSAPRRRKPITIASGLMGPAGEVTVDCLLELPSLPAFEQWLMTPGPWLAGFDFPFGLPRELLVSLGWPTQHGWPAMIEHVGAMPRAEMVSAFKAFCDGRPNGRKFAHRATDGPAGSSPSMKWVNPPVALMLHAGAPALLCAGVHLPGLHEGDRTRVALEAYPGLLARRIVGRQSYKSDDRSKQTPARAQNRVQILHGLLAGEGTQVPRCQIVPQVMAQLADDPSADRLDAVLCLAQAAWAWERRHAGYGLPAEIDPLEGWIVSAPIPV